MIEGDDIPEGFRNEYPETVGGIPFTEFELNPYTVFMLRPIDRCLVRAIFFCRAFDELEVYIRDMKEYKSAAAVIQKAKEGK